MKILNIVPVIFLSCTILMPSSMSCYTNTDDTEIALEQNYPDDGHGATINGTISFVGEAPKPRQIDMGFDPKCLSSNPKAVTEDIVIIDGKLANVCIYVRSKLLGSYNFEPPTSPVRLERIGCQIVPHVLGVQTKQVLLILNNDKTTHNTNIQPRNNVGFSVTQPPGGEPIKKIFEQAEAFITVRDNHHPWEQAYIGVFAHPFFTVSNKQGHYKISGLPAGQYTVVAWHERYGERTEEVYLAAQESKVVSFTFTKER